MRMRRRRSRSVRDRVDDWNIHGVLKIVELDKNGVALNTVTLYNKFMAGGGDIIAQLLTGATTFQVATLYLEFENGSPPAVVEPAYVAADGLEYYTGLTPPKDYLRVPITLNPTITSSDAAKYAGNQATFFGITAGLVGVNGLPFSEAAGSTVYGGALVASPTPADPTADRIFARTYWVDRLFPKHDGRQIGVQWTVRIVAND